MEINQQVYMLKIGSDDNGQTIQRCAKPNKAAQFVTKLRKNRKVSRRPDKAAQKKVIPKYGTLLAVCVDLCGFARPSEA